MNYIDLDQPSQSDSAGADVMNSPENASANQDPRASNEIKWKPPQPMRSPDGTESKPLALMLARVMELVNSVSVGQQQLMGDVANLAATAPGKGGNGATPKTAGDDVRHSPRAPQRSWSQTEHKPVAAIAKESPRAADRPSERQSPDRSQARQPEPPAVRTLKSPDCYRSPAEAELRSPEPSRVDVHLKSLRQTSQKIIEHENRHAAVLRDSGADPAARPKLTEARGADGRHYAVAGEVNADLSPIGGNPHATEKKAESVYRSAVSDQDRSPEDNAAARQAEFAAQAARRERIQAIAPESPKSNPAQMESPHNPTVANPYQVKMHNPIAGFMAGTRFIGGAVARGVAASGAAPGAAGWLQSAPSSTVGSGFAAGAGVETRAQAVAVAFDNLNRSTDKLETNFLGLSERLKNFSPDVAIQNAFNNINRINQNYRQAQELGKPLAEFEKQRGRIEIAGRDMQGNAAQILLPILNAALQTGATIAETLAAISGYIVNVPILSEFVIDSLAAMVPGLGALVKIARERDRDAKAQAIKDQMAMSKSNLNSFFKMQIPPPQATPQIKGPNMAMPLNIPAPQPFRP